MTWGGWADLALVAWVLFCVLLASLLAGREWRRINRRVADFRKEMANRSPEPWER